ncbi:MAG: hypothetical protein L3J94_02865 [Gammaproteobacteria bacterium]|nr:hypothetical protein [Gammaproteobacteria bacterium]
MRNIILKIIDACLALFVGISVGFFLHWVLGVALTIYCLKRIFFPRPETRIQTPSFERKKALEDMRRREDKEEFDQRFFDMGFLAITCKN